MKKMKRLVMGCRLGVGVFLSFILITHSSLLITTAYAEDASSSGKIQAALKTLETEIASKAAQIKSQIGKQVENRLVTGLVQSKTDSQIILAQETQSSTTNDYDPNANKNATVSIDKFTTYEYQGDAIKTVKQDDFVVALGDLDDRGNLVAKKVVKEDPPDTTPIIYFWGKVTEATPSAIMVQGKDKNQSVSLNKNTSYQMADKAASSKSLEKDQTVITVGSIDASSQSLIAQFIYIFPQVATSSPSASASATLKK